MTTDLTKGSPAKLILYFAIPYLIGNLFQQFYNIADTVIVGRILGMNALAAVGATGSFVWLALGTIQGLTTGFAAVTAQRFGAEDVQGIKKSFAMSIYLSIVSTVILTGVCLFFAYPMLKFLETPEEIIVDSYKFIRWIFIGIFSTMLFNLLSNMIRALGDSKTPLIFLAFSSIINIVLAYVLITYGGMGPEGTGLATFLAQVFSGILCVLYIVRKLPVLHLSKEDLKIDIHMIKQLMKIGLPMALLNSILAVGGIVIQFVNNGLGTLYVASYSAANKIEQIIIQPIISFGAATAVFAAQNYGAREFKRIRVGVNQGLGMTIIWAVLSAALVFFFGKYAMLAVAGSGNSELVENGYFYLTVSASLCIILTPLVIYKSVLQSMGRAIVPIATGFIEVFCRACGAIYLSQFFGFKGLCFSSPLAWLGALIPIAIDYFIFTRNLKNR